MFVFVLVLILPLRYSNPVHDNENNPAYAPVDTAIISFPHPFCERITITKPRYIDDDFPVISTIYLLKTMPTLGKLDSATFYREVELSENQYQYWKIFLYPGSNISYLACYQGSLTEPWGTFYLVKGNNDFTLWKDGHSDVSIHDETIDASCEDNNDSTFSFLVEKEDNYYFIFQKDNNLLASLGVTFNYDRLLYNTSDDDIVSQCSIILNDSKQCSADVPLSFKAIALLELDTLEPGLNEWDPYINLNVDCSARVWLYAVIAISVFVFLGVLVISSVILYMCFCRRKKSVRRNNSAHEESTLLEEDDPPTYDTYDAPPPYKPE